MTTYPVSCSTSELKVLASGMQKLGFKLKDALQGGKYEAFVVDSGEYPVLVEALRTFMKMWQQNVTPETELPIVRLNVANDTAGSAQCHDDLKKLRTKIDGSGGKRKLLVVAATINRAKAVAACIPKIMNSDVEFDVATLGSGTAGGQLQIVFKAEPTFQDELVKEIEEALLLQHLSPLQVEKIMGPKGVERKLLDSDVKEMVERLRTHTVDDAFIDTWNMRIAGIRSSSQFLNTTQVWEFHNLITRTSNVHMCEPDVIQELIYLLSNGEVKLYEAKMLQFHLSGSQDIQSIVKSFNVFRRRMQARKDRCPSLRGTSDSPPGSFGLPNETDLYSGGLKEKFVEESLAALRDGAQDCTTLSRQIVRDLERIAEWSQVHSSCRGKVVPQLTASMATLLDQMKEYIRNDEYGFIVGDDTSGRVPTLLIAKAINAYRTELNLKKLPVVFIEGTKRPHTKEQIQSFTARARFLNGIPAGKRALIVTECVGGGNNVQSIMERVRDLGFASDVATLGGASHTELASLIAQGYWRQGTRGFSADGDSNLLMDRSELSGLNPRRKFDPHPVIKGKEQRQALEATRSDIRSVTPFLKQYLE
ncbi:MAG: phosphoribosyltransferase [Candidatus Dormibacteria bacterium]